ncbi:MAG: tRNA(Ile2) 2-agmatinylcytidine synthetase, partial [Halobaculum sp.]
GHVFFDFGDSTAGNDDSVRCVAFEPTKRFRGRIRALRPGDDLTVCGEFDDGTIKLEKFAVRSLNRTELVVPTCPDCGNSMESAGAGQGYRCRDCGTAEPGKVEREVERELERGWYEVPPCARRHVAKPLVRSGFDAPTHPER